MSLTLHSAISTFGASAKAKLVNLAAKGAPEDQLRAPLEILILDLAELCGLARGAVASVGETALAELKTRPDYAVTVQHTLVGFIEVKAPGKGADPRHYKDRHDKAQWAKLQSLPNLLYTDGNEFSLWQNGDLVGAVVRLTGDIASVGQKLAAPPALLGLFESFFQWQPIAPKEPRQLAEVSARLCRLLREEVAEQLAIKNPALTTLKVDWRTLLFPEASDAQFADGYAQAVTFGLLMARARGIQLSTNFDQVAKQLRKTNSLIGAALRLLTDDDDNRAMLKTSLDTLARVLDAVDWPTISKGDPEAWLYFYEHFLEIYDNDLRKQTGSYYTPPEVVAAMVRLVDEILRSPQRFNLYAGLAAPEVTVADPAVGTGTFLLGTLRRIAQMVASDEGPGAVPAAMIAALSRIVGFELQLGPFAVAQLRLFAELTELIGAAPKTPLRLFVTDTLGNPYAEEEHLSGLVAPIGESRRQANAIKREQPITVVIGNPPYKEKAKGRGGWVESGSPNANEPAPLEAWMAPPEWGVSAHTKHLRNLYIYFWRWATWKVFDRHPQQNTGVVCFITVAGFLNGPGFQKMRDYLRRTADEIWVVDCSPEGHQPEVPTRIFEGVQQPICIVLVARSHQAQPDIPATVHFLSLPKGSRQAKFAALADLNLDAGPWAECSSDWRAPFMPQGVGAWPTYPALDDLFRYNGSGVMPGRTWVIAPDAQSLRLRWQKLLAAPSNTKELLFHPHLRNGQPGDKHSKRIVPKSLSGYPPRPLAVADETGDCIPPVRYGFRSFDRQWIIPDNRLINQPNPELWEVYSGQQVYLTAPSDRSPTSGPALTLTSTIPDLHHYSGRGGRAFPLWRDREASVPNMPAALLDLLSQRYGFAVCGEDLLAYIAAVAAHPAFTARFQADLIQPGLRIPLTASGDLFTDAVEIGRRVIWLHTYGERYTDTQAGRPAGPPRVTPSAAGRIAVGGAIPSDPDAMPDMIDYDAANGRLLVGQGFIEGVRPAVWAYEVSGKKVLRQWFSYRKANRERPIIGDRRPPSALGDIQPAGWPAEYTTELINLLHVLTWVIELEPAQADLLTQICTAPTITVAEVRAAGARDSAEPVASAGAAEGQASFL